MLYSKMIQPADYCILLISINKQLKEKKMVLFLDSQGEELSQVTEKARKYLPEIEKLHHLEVDGFDYHCLLCKVGHEQGGHQQLNAVFNLKTLSSQEFYQTTLN